MDSQDIEGSGTDRAFELLAGLTARLASTANLDEIVDTVLDEIVALGFGAAWMAVLDERTGHLVTIKEVIDGVDTTHEMPKIFMADMRQPIGHGFRERRMINIKDPDSLCIIEDGDDPVPEGALALPRVIYEHLRGHPFACGPLLGSRGQPVGALGLSSYRGREPIPDQLFEGGLLRAFMDHLGIAMERASHVTRLERLNADLVKAQEGIERDARLKAVGELAAAVAHDLNNLAGIALMAVSVGRRSPSSAFEVLPRIERTTRAIGDLVERLQRAARSDQIGEADAADAAQVVEDALLMLRPILGESFIEVDADTPAVPPVRVAPVILHQVVLNLLLNARDALEESPEEGRKIRVQLRDDPGVVRLYVTDTGPGISPEVRETLFQPFVSTKSSGHPGLGLAAARASLEHFGGKLEGRNAARGGAVFEVTLEPAPAGAAGRAPAEDPAAEPAPGDAQPHRILVVDDDPDVLFIIEAFLEPQGHEVVSAASGGEALELARNQRFDLVLCDVGMPKQSGLDVLEALRSVGFDGKVALMTGWDAERVQADERTSDSDALIKKPFAGPKLLEVVERVLRA